jgi:hypothetical protein
MLSRGALAAAAFAAALVALALAYLEVRRDNRAYRDELAELRTSMGQLRSQVGGLEVAGQLQRATAVEREPRGDEREGAAAAGEGRGEGRVEGEGERAGEGAAPPAASFEESFRLAEEQFHGEAIDAAWAGGATAAVQQALAQIAPPGSVRGLSCHSTRCRLELSLRDEAEAEAFQREALYGGHVLWRGQMMISRDARADGRVAMVAHLVREAR